MTGVDVRSAVNVLIVDAIGARAESVARALRRTGDSVAGIVNPNADLVAVVTALNPDVLIMDLDAPTDAMIEQIQQISHQAPRPIIMFAHNKESERIQAVIRAGVSSYVVDGFSDDRVRAIIDVAIARFNEFHELKVELTQTRGQLEARKIIERAKGILMSQRRCDEPEAHHMLQKFAMQRRKSLVQVAEEVISLANLFDPGG